MMISFLLELHLLQPWLAWPDLGRLERVARALHHDVLPVVWQDELLRVLHLCPRVRTPVLTGKQLACGYLGGRNEWRGPSYLAVAKEALRPAHTPLFMSLWRFLVSLLYLSTPTTWCFYRTSVDMVEALPDMYYFEVSLRHLVREPRDECCLSVGLAADPDVLQTTGWMVGWTMDSIGLHTDEGVIRLDNRVVHEISSPLIEGDVVGCGWRRSFGVWMAFFTVNGKQVYQHPFSWAAPYPMVVHDPSADFVYETNFGATPFLFLHRLKN